MSEEVILLVEDDSGDQVLTLKALRRNGIVNGVVIARDGVDALDYLFGKLDDGADNASTVTLVLLDLNLPRIDGLEVLRRIRADERTRGLPVVVLTASRDQEDELQSQALGAHAFVRKPVAFRDFREATRALGVSWLLLGERGAPKISNHLHIGANGG